MITTTTAQSPKGCIIRIQMLGSIETTHPLYRRIFSNNVNMSLSVPYHLAQEWSLRWMPSVPPNNIPKS